MVYRGVEEGGLGVHPDSKVGISLDEVVAVLLL